MSTQNAIENSNKLEFIEENTLSADTTTTFSSLSGVKRYLLVYEMTNATGTASQIGLRLNGDANENDYARQLFNANGSTLSSSITANSAAPFAIGASDSTVGWTNIGLADLGGGNYRALYFAFNTIDTGAVDVIYVQNRAVRKNTSVTGITQIEIVATVASSMNGSIKLYEITS